MDHRDESDSRWDNLTNLLRRMRDGRDFSLAEAQRRFAAAPDLPFSARAVQVMVVAATMVGSENSSAGEHLLDFVFASDAHAAAGDAFVETNVFVEGSGFLEGPGGELRDGELDDIVGWHPWAVADGWVTDIDSTAIDTRGVRWTRLPLDLRGTTSTDPIVLDVGAGFDELATLALRKTRDGTFRDGTLRWDVCLGSAESELLDYAVVCTTSFDFANYDDEVIEELLRN